MLGFHTNIGHEDLKVTYSDVKYSMCCLMTAFWHPGIAIVYLFALLE